MHPAPVARPLDRLWQASPALTATGLLMIPLLALFAAGLWLDPRTIAGAPAWLKPAKFAASIAIYALTLAWVFTYLPDWVRTRAIVGRVSAAVLIVEIAIIGLQAWRGTTSHFNVATTVDAVLFRVMGLGIIVQTMTSVAAAVALWRTAFADRVTGWALRLGVTMTIVGATAGGLMVAPTAEQIEAARVAPMTVAGAHTVGAADGGPGLPGTGWSTDHGDLRVPHFVGLHALQALALLALVLPAGWSEPQRVRAVFVGAASYSALFGILTWQALEGEPLIAPSPAVVGTLIAWAAASAIAWLAVTRAETRSQAALC